MDSHQNPLAAFDAFLADVTMAVRPIMDIQVSDPGSEQLAQSAAGQVATLLKEVEKRRKDMIAPYKAQIDAITAAADKVKAALAGPDKHVRLQLDTYAAEVRRKREEELRAVREREEADRRAADEKRRKEEAELRAKQEAERRAHEEEAAAERKRIYMEHEAKQRQIEIDAANRAAAAVLFGSGMAAKEQAEREAAEAKRQAEEKAAAEQRAAADQKAAEERAAADRRALDEQQERDRIAKQARMQREEDERAKVAEDARKEIEAQKVKGAKVDFDIQVVDAWAVPREFLRAPEVQLNDVKKAYKAGRREIPGLVITEVSKVSVRQQPVQSKLA